MPAKFLSSASWEGDRLTGLDKILSEIKNESEKEIKKILDAAHQEARQISEAAKAKSEEAVRQRNEAATQKIKERSAGFDTSLDIQRRRQILAKKQSLIAETLQKAKETLCGLPDGEYIDLLLKLAAQSAQPGEGVVLLNDRDKERLPADFESRLNGALPEGASLTVSGDTLPIRGGIVLQYGNIVENSSIDSVFDERLDALSDLVRDALFADMDETYSKER